MSHHAPSRSDHWSTALCCLVAAALAAATMDSAVASARADLADAAATISDTATRVVHGAARLADMVEAW